MNSHYVVPVFSNVWWMGLLSSALFIFMALFIGRKLQPEGRKKLGMALGALFLFLVIAMNIYEWHEGSWNLQKSLPLHLCAMSSILSGLVFFWPNQRAYELLVFWGIPGSLHSLLTPEMSHGNADFIVFEYYVSHAGIILSALYLPYVMGKNMRMRSWFSNFVFTLGVVLLTGALNYFLDANYMYLCQRPLADNPMIIGEWPWYIFVLVAVVLIHFILVYWLYKKMGWVVTA